MVRDIQIRLPGRFWRYYDEASRASGELIRNYGPQVEIRCTGEELEGINKEAQSYAASSRWADDRRLIASAKRTVKRIAYFRERLKFLAGVRQRAAGAHDLGGAS